MSIAEKSICFGKVHPGQVIFKINEHEVRVPLSGNGFLPADVLTRRLVLIAFQVGTHSEAVALLDKAANGIVKLELSKIAADDETVESVARSPNKSTSSKNLFAEQ